LPTEALQERWWLGWLRILSGLSLCSGILYRPDLDPRILMPLDPCSRMPDLCPRTLDGPDSSVLSNVPDGSWIVFQDLCSCILCRLFRLGFCLRVLYRLRRLGLRLCIFPGRPSPKLLQHGSGWRLADFRLALIGGSSFGTTCCAPCSRRQSLS
jgi:hypothetical protein